MATMEEARRERKIAALEAAARVVASKDGNTNKSATDVTLMATSLLAWLER